MSIEQNIISVRCAIASAARKCGRCPEEITLVGVSKTFGASSVKQAIKAGLCDIAENRIDEAEEKFPLFPGVKKHFIGRLQGNKVSRIVAVSDMIQSVDSLKTAQRISDYAIAVEKRMPVLVQILTDGKKQFGIIPSELEAFLREASRMDGIRIQGLMTIGPDFANPEDSRMLFKQMKSLYNSSMAFKILKAEFRYLSMGMSGDYAIAIEEGANMVRVGTAIFGER